VRLFVDETAVAQAGAPASGSGVGRLPRAPRLPPLTEEAERGEGGEGGAEKPDEKHEEKHGEKHEEKHEEIEGAREAEAAEESHRLQLVAPQGARAIAEQAGAGKAAAVWRYVP